MDVPVIVIMRNIQHGEVPLVNSVVNATVKPANIPKQPKRHNRFAQQLRDRRFHQRVVKNKKKVYVRENNKFKFVVEQW